MAFTFPKQDRLLRRSEFLAAQSRGARVHTPHLTLVLRDRSDGAGPRLGVTTSRKVGPSVRRSRLRRLVREVFRLNKPAFPAGFDCVVVVHERAPDLPFAAVRDEILGALARRARRAIIPGAPPPRDTKKPSAAAAPPPRAQGPTRR